MTYLSVGLGLCALSIAACTPMQSPGDHGAIAAADERCIAHRRETAGKSPAEQRAAAEAHIRAMHGTADAAHVERHLKMMEQRCGPPAAR